MNTNAREHWSKAWRLVRVSQGKISDWTICQTGIPWRFARMAICFYEIRTSYREVFGWMGIPLSSRQAKLGQHYDRGTYHNL